MPRNEKKDEDDGKTKTGMQDNKANIKDAAETAGKASDNAERKAA